MKKKSYQKLVTQVRKQINVRKKIVSAWAKQHRLQLASLALIFFGVSLVGSQFIHRPEEQTAETQTQALSVQVVTFGDTSLNEKTVGTVKNLTSITLVAQSAGPVSVVDVVEGDVVHKGTRLLEQETAYAAGNAAVVSRQIAAKSFEIADETLKNTVESVAKTREQADLNRDNTEELRKMAEKNQQDTNSLLETVEAVVITLEQNLSDEIAGTNDSATVLALRQSLVAYKNTLAGTRASVRSLDYSNNQDNPPTKLANITKDLIYLQTDLQLKTAQLNRDIASLSYRVARIQEAATRVQAPFEGVVEKLYVHEGEYLTPGTPVAVIRGQTKLCLQINIAGKLAAQIDQSQMLTVDIKGLAVAIPITHVSGAPVNGQLYEVLAQLPEETLGRVYEDQTLNVTLPLYSTTVQTGNSFVPIDAIFVTNTNRYVFVEEDGLAQKREVVTGEIVGTSIEIKTGLVPGEKVILDRRVIDQQPIEVELLNNLETVIELG